MDCYEITPEKFSEALFAYLWFTENLVSASTAAEITGGLTEFVIEVSKAVVLLSSLSVQTFYNSMEKHFQEHGINRRSVFTFLAQSCFQLHDKQGDIFLVILETLSYTYQLVVYCQGKGFLEYFNLASMCWSEIFDAKLKADFSRNGGWSSFLDYVYGYGYVPKETTLNEDYYLGFLQAMDCLFPKIDSQISGDERYPDFVTEEKLMEMKKKLDRVIDFDNIDDKTIDENLNVVIESLSQNWSDCQPNYLVQLVHASIVSLRALAMPSTNKSVE